MATHVRLTVKIAEHEAANPAWRIQHASETIALVFAWFEQEDGVPAQNDDGTFIVHAPSRDTLGTLREMLTDHEGFTIVKEDEAPGLGILAERRQALGER